MANGVKFIRVRGRIVPVRDKSNLPSNSTSYKKSEILKSTARADLKKAETAKKVSVFSAAAAATAVGRSLASKSKSLLGAGAALGLLSFTAGLQASARAKSAKQRLSYAGLLRKGKKIPKFSGIGNAAQMAYRDAKLIESAPKSATNSIYKTRPNNQNKSSV